MGGTRAMFPPANGVIQARATGNPVQIRFAAPSFSAPEVTQFRFQLEGVDSEWRRAVSPEVSYAKLEPGKYRFQVMARGENGSWSNPPATVMLQIFPPVWETGWFKAGLVAAALLLILGFALAAAAKQRQLDGLRQQITRDLHDDLGSNIGSIALLSEALQRGPSNGELLAEIQRISRQTLDSMRDAVWFVDPEKDSSGDLVAHLKVITNSMLKNTNHTFEEDEGERSSTIPLNIKRGVVLIYKETLHNVLRHSGATAVRIVVSGGGGSFSFRVSDNGRGFDPGEPSRGLGLRNIRHRAEKLKADLEIRSAAGEGTEVEFRVKFA